VGCKQALEYRRLQLLLSPCKGTGFNGGAFASTLTTKISIRLNLFNPTLNKKRNHLGIQPGHPTRETKQMCIFPSIYEQNESWNPLDGATCTTMFRRCASHFLSTLLSAGFSITGISSLSVPPLATPTTNLATGRPRTSRLGLAAF
jgi:hypothetical protein